MLKSKLTVAVVAALAFAYSSAYAGDLSSQAATSSQQDASSAQDASQSQTPEASKAKKLQTITVTGSLIPQTEIETATPVTTITTEDMKARGFSTVADALQGVSFAAGSVQGSQTSGGFTQGAETVSLFGLSPSYTKYLINGRPMGSFPALYNGSDTFNNIAGLPAELVDHIDILPGGQSSLYGSDAIAGVINIVLKDHIDSPTLSARYGWSTGGGGANRRLSGADSWQFGKFNLLAGFQLDSKQPIWGTDRGLTAHKNDHGISAPYASYDVLEYSALNNNLYFMDPNKCANVAGLFHGTEKLSTHNGYEYCGSQSSGGYRTLTNRVRSGSAYAHATYDFTPNTELYGDLLYRYSDTRYTAGSNYMWWGTGSKYGAFWDPNVNDGNGDLVNFQKAFAPEEMSGGYSDTLSKQYDTSVFFTLGLNGTFGDSNWDYDVGLTHSEEHLTNSDFSRFTNPINGYFDKILGPQLNVDPIYGYYPVFSPNYAQFYSTVSTADFDSFTGYVNTHSKTWNNMLRAQFTNASLFSLPGGDAGLAVVAEGGNEGWNYSPAEQLLNGDVWGMSAVQGAGHRSRYALTTELRLPVFKMLTLDVSGRRDSYKVSGENLGKTTYMAGIEFRPFKSLLFRGRYGKAFKAPTLSDEFQGLSGFYDNVTDYYTCSQLGFDPAHSGDCPTRYSQYQVYGEQSGNTKLKPINATVWSYGVVWAPSSNFNVSVDYFHTDIDNEVNQQSADGLMLTEYQCRTGILDINSQNCQEAFSQLTRDASGALTYIYLPKVNVSNETTNNVILHFTWLASLGDAGDLAFHGSYSDTLKHTQQAYPSDPDIDLLRHPAWSTYFKTKENLTISWSRQQWGASFYINRFGSTPNYISTTYDDYTSNPNSAWLKPWTLYNASINYQVTPGLGLSFMVNNLFNKMPPVDYSYSGSSSAPYNSGNYNVYGRAMYLEATYKFGK